MTTRSSTVSVKVIGDAKGLTKTMNDSANSLVKFEAKAKRTDAVLSKLFGKSHKASVTLDDNKFDAAYKALQRKLRSLENELVTVDIDGDPTKIIRDISKVQKALHGLERQAEGVSFSRASTSVSRTNDGLLTMVGRVGMIGGAIAGAIGTFKLLFDSTVGAAANFEQMQIQFTYLLGKNEKAAQIMLEWIEDYAAKTPFQTDEITSAAKALLTYGYSAKESRGALKAMGDASAATGNDLSELTVIIGQIRSSTSATNEDLKQFQERGVDVYGILAKELGKSKGEIKKLVSEGLLSGEEAARLIEQGIAAYYGGATAALSKTILGRWSTVKDNLLLTLKNLGTELLPLVEMLLPGVEKFATANAEVVGKMGPQLARSIAAGLQVALKGIQSFIIVTGQMAAAFLTAGASILRMIADIAGSAAKLGAVLGPLLGVKFSGLGEEADSIRKVADSWDVAAGRIVSGTKAIASSIDDPIAKLKLFELGIGKITEKGGKTAITFKFDSQGVNPILGKLEEVQKYDGKRVSFDIDGDGIAELQGKLKAIKNKDGEVIGYKLITKSDDVTKKVNSIPDAKDVKVSITAKTTGDDWLLKARGDYNKIPELAPATKKVTVDVNDNGSAGKVKAGIEAIPGAKNVGINVSDGGRASQILSTINAIPTSKNVIVTVRTVRIGPSLTGPGGTLGPGLLQSGLSLMSEEPNVLRADVPSLAVGRAENPFDVPLFGAEKVVREVVVKLTWDTSTWDDRVKALKQDISDIEDDFDKQRAEARKDNKKTSADRVKLKRNESETEEAYNKRVEDAERKAEAAANKTNKSRAKALRARLKEIAAEEKQAILEKRREYAAEYANKVVEEWTERYTEAVDNYNSALEEMKSRSEEFTDSLNALDIGDAWSFAKDSLSEYNEQLKQQANNSGKLAETNRNIEALSAQYAYMVVNASRYDQATIDSVATALREAQEEALSLQVALTPPKSLRTALQDQVNTTYTFISKITALRNAGVGGEALAEILSQGAEAGIEIADALLSDPGLAAEYQRAFSEMAKVSADAGVQLSKDMYGPTIAKAAEAVDAIEQEFSQLPARINAYIKANYKITVDIGVNYKRTTSTATRSATARAIPNTLSRVGSQRWDFSGNRSSAAPVYNITVNTMVADRNTGRNIVKAIESYEASAGKSWRGV